MNVGDFRYLKINQLMKKHYQPAGDTQTKRIQPARGWCATTVQIVSTYPASPEARPPSFLGKPAVRPRSMAGGAPTPCGRH